MTCNLIVKAVSNIKEAQWPTECML